MICSVQPLLSLLALPYRPAPQTAVLERCWIDIQLDSVSGQRLVMHE